MKKTFYIIIFISTLQLLQAQNIFPTDGNVGIGLAFPEAKLDVAGNGRFSTGILSSENNSFEKVFTNAAIFENGISNLAVDIRFGNLSFWGYIEVEVTGSFSYQNSVGKLTKLYTIGTNPDNNIYINESRVSDAMGTITDNISLGDFSWDSTNNCFKIPVSHIASTHNAYTIKIKMFTHGGGAKAVYDILTIGPNYSLPALQRNYVYFNNNLGIGITNPTNKLDVNGTIHSKVVKVDMAGWSDFVFKKEYKLPTLEEVEKHIAEKGHLENIPSEEEVLKNGINLGEMNAKLLQKIEELTLHMIQQNNKIEKLEKKIENILTK